MYTHVGEILDGGTGSTWPYLHAQHQAFLMCGPFKAEEGEAGREYLPAQQAASRQLPVGNCRGLLDLLPAPAAGDSSSLHLAQHLGTCTLHCTCTWLLLKDAPACNPNAMGCAEQNFCLRLKSILFPMATAGSN